MWQTQTETPATQEKTVTTGKNINPVRKQWQLSVFVIFYKDIDFILAVYWNFTEFFYLQNMAQNGSLWDVLNFNNKCKCMLSETSLCARGQITHTSNTQAEWTLSIQIYLCIEDSRSHCKRLSLRPPEETEHAQVHGTQWDASQGLQGVGWHSGQTSLHNIW